MLRSIEIVTVSTAHATTATDFHSELEAITTIFAIISISKQSLFHGALECK